MHQQDQQQRLQQLRAQKTTSSADSKDNASVNDSKQNAEVNNSAESQSTNGKVAQPKSENKAKAEKDGQDQQKNESMVESTTETLPSADITEPNVLLIHKR
ncbi:hypothetical protein ACVXZY_12995 [Staphylococcus aureus]